MNVLNAKEDIEDLEFSKARKKIEIAGGNKTK